MKRRSLVTHAIAFVLLWGAFLSFGLYLRTQMPWEGFVELHGFDYAVHGFFFSDWSRILTPGFRHPFFALFTAPLPLFGCRLLEIGPWPYWCFLLMVFASVMACAVMLVYSVLRAASGLGRAEAAAGAALFLSFSYTWLLSACPESFPVACVVGLLVLRWGLSPWSSRGKVGRIGWCALTFLNGGITTSNAVKVVLAFLAVRGITRQRLLRMVALGAALIIVFFAGVLLRYLFYNITHDVPKGHLSDGWVTLFDFFSETDFKGWLAFAGKFFSEPIVTHGDRLTVNVLVRHYGSIAAPAAVVMLYAAAIAGAFRARRHPLVRMALAMCLVDVVLHLVLRWGLHEGHIYCGHWFYTPAILAAMLPATCNGKARRLLLAGLFVLALAIFVCGIHAFVTAPPITGAVG